MIIKKDTSSYGECQTCAFWRPISKHSALTFLPEFQECRRRAPVGPQLFGVMNEDKMKACITSAFCITASDDGCGDHKPMAK